MKFIALLISTAAAAEVKSMGDCSVKDATCATADCCGTVTQTDAEKTTRAGPTTKVCFTKPTDEAKGLAYVIALVAKEGENAEKPAGAGIFKCAAADAAGASYMTVGAAVLAAAALLQ